MEIIEKEDLRITRTRKSLIEAFITLMKQKKFEEITINDLCDEAMVRRTTFYRHFEDKYDLFNFVIKHYQQEFSEYNQLQETGQSMGNWHSTILNNCLVFISENDKLFKLALNSSVLPMLLDSLLSQIEISITEKYEQLQGKAKKSNISPDIIGSFIGGGILNVFHKLLLERERQDEIIAQLQQLLDLYS